MKLLPLIIFSLILISSALALDCQYTQTENYPVQEEVYYHNNVEIGRNLNLSNLVTVEVQGFDIRINNNLEVPVTITVIYHRASNWFGINEDRTITRTVNSHDFDIITDEMSSTFGCGSSYPCGISLTKYQFSEPNIITHKSQDVIKQRQICKLCGAENCLNDGSACNPLYDDSKCGSGICNIAGLCGNNKVVDCPDGLQNCNDKQCLKPSTKEVGEGYSCSFECKSGRFNNEKCLTSIINLILFGVFCLVILCAGIWYFLLIRANNIKRLLDKYKAEIEDLRMIRNGLNSDISEFNMKVLDLQNEMQEKTDKIKALKSDIKNAKPQARKLLEDQLNKLSSEYERKKKEMQDNYSSEISSCENRLSESQKRLSEVKEEETVWKKKAKNIKKKAEHDYEQAWKLMEESRHKIEDEIKLEQDRLQELSSKRKAVEIESISIEDQSEKNRIKRALQKYNKNDKLVYNQVSKYLVFKDSGELYHKWVYESYLRKKGEPINHDKSIHHIDREKLNNDLRNLIPINKKRHDIKEGESQKGKFNHDLIQPGNWTSGIEQLIDQLGMKEDDFPDYIRKDKEFQKIIKKRAKK